MKAENVAISVSLFNLIERESFITAREGAEAFQISSMKASAILTRMEIEGMIRSKRVKVGRNEVKCYYKQQEVQL